MYLKMKGIKEVYTSNVSKTLQKHGIIVSPSELMNLLQNASFVSDISGDKISINGKNISTEPTSPDSDESSKDDKDNNKSKEKDFDMDEYKVSQMAKRRLSKKD